MTGVGLGDNGVAGDGFPGVLGTSTDAVTESGTQEAFGYERAGGCHALACRLVETSGVTPFLPW